MDYSSSFAIRLRLIGQRLGILRPLVRLYRQIFAKTYEERFHQQLLKAIQFDDVVWDVGANIGFYTTTFSELVGRTGTVVAFEPSPRAFSGLKSAVELITNVVTYNVALSNAKGKATFYINESEEGTTDSLRQRTIQTRGLEVDVERGDAFRLDHPPNVIKIDVEGFELEVLQGMSGVLSDSSLRSVFIEVHFQELASRGLPEAPSDIVVLLQAAGLVPEWVAPSHLAAFRRQ